MRIQNNISETDLDMSRGGRSVDAVDKDKSDQADILNYMTGNTMLNIVKVFR